MANPFEHLTYVEIDYTAIPSGWTNQEKRDSRKRVNRSVGEQSTNSHLDTGHRKYPATIFDEEGELTQTADRALFRIDARQYADEQELIDTIIAEIADELGKTIQAVSQKVSIAIIGGQQEALDHIAANKAAWGEQ